MSIMTVGQAIVKFLDNQYVEMDGVETKFVDGVFTIFGHGIVVGLGQALDEDPGSLRVYQGRNEQGMAHAATGFARQHNRRKIIACASSIGPGAANMVTAAACATVNRIPLLLFPGDTFAVRQPDPVLQQIEQTQDLSISTNDAFRAVCRYWDRIARPEQLMSAMINAFRVLTDPANTGAVCIAIPQDVEGEACDYPEAFFAKRVWRIERRPATEIAIRQAAEAIRGAKKPMLICGGGVRYSEAHAEFQAFAEQFGIPFGETQAGKSAIVWNHPLNLGGMGVTGCSAANEIAKDADVIIGVGTRYTDFTTSSKWLFREDAKFVNINVSEFQAYKLDAVPVIADAKAALPEIEKALKGYRSGYSGEIEAAIAKWNAEYDRLSGIEFGENYAPEVQDANSGSAFTFAKDMDACLTQTAALAAINRHIPKDACVIGAAGSLPGCMQRMWRAHTQDTYNMEYGYSCMGYEISGALGVKLAAGDREVYSMVGDGSFIMLHSELLTAVQEHKKINICLFDNASYGCINNLQNGQGNATLCTERRFRNPETGRHDGKFMPVDFAAIARAYGCTAYTVRTMNELTAAIEAAKEIRDVPVLFDIKVLPKSMTEGYGAWWRVGTPAVSEKEGNQKAYRDLLAHLETARKY